MALTDKQIERYSRHLILQGVGIEGQNKLCESKVLVIGAGGLGSPSIMYLAASGIGTIGIVDGDDVDLSNMQRQIIHKEENIGTSKAESAARRVKEINPEVQVRIYQERITPDNIMERIKEYDFIIDGVDNFATKFLINDACVLAKKPFCHAGIREFYGQVMTYVPGQGPCYRCLFEEIPKDGDVDTCSTAGVIGSIPGIIGSIQALEAQKYLLGVGELLTGKILTFDGLTMKFRTVKIEDSSPDCRVCGEQADIFQIRREEYVPTTCSLQQENETTEQQLQEQIKERTLSYQKFMQGVAKGGVLIDLREEEHTRFGAISKAVFISAKEQERLFELPKEDKLYLYCQRGEKSEKLLRQLLACGYDAYQLQGGYLTHLANMV